MIETIGQAIPALGRVLQTRLSEPAAMSAAEKIAIRAVWSATDNTRMYLRQIEEGSVPWPAPNRELVRLWSDAAVEIAAIDLEFSQRLRAKAEYWSDPLAWNRQSVQDAGIQIDRIADDARALLQRAVPSPPIVDSPASVDLFISHASEDKEGVARPLAEALRERGRTVWYDEFALTGGDHLIGAIDRGLLGCRYGAVILTESFFRKNWPLMEVQGLLALENRDRRKRIVPIRHNMSHADLVGHSPLLAGRLSLSTDGGIDAVVREVERILQK